MLESGKDPVAIAAERGFEAMATSELGSLLDEIIAANPDDWAAYVEADDKKAKKLTGVFIGQLMKKSRGQADGKTATLMLQKRRSEAQ